MSDWYWKVIALKAAFVLTCFVSYLRADDDNIQKLPFCNPHNNANGGPVNHDLVLVSTLDGKLTAFSTENGNKAWDLETQPLLSSNLHHVELTAGGKWVRLVPSLRGTLYSLSGETIEPLPFDAEQLLSASFKYSDDLVIAGARETNWLGLDATSGSVLYECGSHGCNSEQQTAGAAKDILVLRRHSNTVRALDPRTGNEKWNFSVAEHQLALSRRECSGGEGPGRTPLAVGVALPEGVVAVRRPGDQRLLWRQQLEAPVAGMWRLAGGALQHLDVLWEAAHALAPAPPAPQAPPSLYIGVHDRQLYIQESLYYAQKLETSVSAKPLPWKLKHSRPLLDGQDNTALSVQDPDPNTLSLITLYGTTEPMGNHGFFLYLQETCDQAVQVTEESIDGPDILPPALTDQEPDHHHIHVHVYSLWFWWKEVLLIAVSSALLMNLMIWPRFFAPKLRSNTPLPVNHQENIIIERYYERPPSTSTPTEYSSRYTTDFTPLRCLGRGGFGVVFEARNNIDHCSYAVKRITLPKRESKRERVLREVRALAKLEHENIVRYFNAWLEEPPPLWQAQRDEEWMRELDGVSVAMTDEYTTPPHKLSQAKQDSVRLELQKSIDDCVDALHYEQKLAELPKRNRSLSCNDSFSIVFEDNASKTSHHSHNSSHHSQTPPHHSQKSPNNNQDFNISSTPDLSKNLGDYASNLSKNVTSGDYPTNDSKNITSGGFGVNLPKNVGSGDNDDSFIVFANSEDGQSEARKESSLDKRLERVKEIDGFTKTDTTSSKKKKGHRRHWSLDLCVRAAGADSKMYLYIQMQLCRRDSLHDWLRHNRTLAARGDKVKVLFSQIVSAVEYVHLAGLIHRDLKPSNIFFAPDGRVKVGDFGLVTAMNDNSQDGVPTDEIDAYARHTYRVGTHLYMSPEQLLCQPYSYKVDIYSLGLILFELLQPFGTEAERVACLLRLRDARYPSSFHEEYPQESEVLKLMLSSDPAQRPTAMGVKARAPLYQQTDERWHFTLPNVTT